MYLTAIWASSIATSNASDGDEAATTERGDSPCRPNRQVQVGLLGLGGKARGRAATLDVDDDHRCLGDDRKAYGLALERQARSARAGDRQRPGKGRAECRTPPRRSRPRPRRILKNR